VVRGQTNRIEFGSGAHASRVTVMSGSATHLAGLALRDLALETAATLLQASKDSLTIADGMICRADGPALPIGEVARALAAGTKLSRERAVPGLTTEGWFHSDHMTYPYGVHLAQVALDRMTGAVAVERYLVAYDVGRAVNPKLVEGQIIGGFAQGLGGALFEEFRYDERGQPLSTTLADYLMPSIAEMPPLDVLVTEDAPSPLNPLGVKGAGEGGTNAVGAAIASAIDDALGGQGGGPGLVTRLPVTPREVLRLLGEIEA
ncbi:MAG: molybdopterin-dependent oxidoreductase, partial [Roseomonas sp.]|nr:molybdopterin-dependent oxidoreductase [Roseomonas sp.]MBX9699252.1 molybdopterin-dependent oxidoreductase [Acetobacteraceae bacterium]